MLWDDAFVKLAPMPLFRPEAICFPTVAALTALAGPACVKSAQMGREIDETESQCPLSLFRP
jgi:hypothetical protein